MVKGAAAGRPGAAGRRRTSTTRRVRPAEVRRRIGMVFQKPNPFPAMSIYDNVASGLRLSGIKVRGHGTTLVEESLRRAGLWNEVHRRLRSPGGALSGGQQQRLCIARSLAIAPDVLLMDEPCSALDPTSTNGSRRPSPSCRSGHDRDRHAQHAAGAPRSDNCAFFLAPMTPWLHRRIRSHPADLRESGGSAHGDYVNGRFG